MPTMLPETARYNARPPDSPHTIMNEQRLIDIESKLAFQEDQLDELNKTAYRQQQEIERLQAICEALARQVRSLADAGNEKAAANERPPHY